MSDTNNNPSQPLLANPPSDVTVYMTHNVAQQPHQQQPKPTTKWSGLSSLWTQEDWCAVWVGLVFFVLTVCSSKMSDKPHDLHKFNVNPFDAWSISNALTLVILYACIWIVVCAALWVMNRPVQLFMTKGIHFIFLIALLSKWVASAKVLSTYGLGAAVWSVLIGTILGNTAFAKEFPVWLQTNKTGSEPACCDEFFIKCNVVMLAVNISSIIEMGGRGVLVAWIDTPILLLFLSWLGMKFPGISSAEAIIMAAATTICGTSAAVAVATVLGVGKENYQTTVAIMSLMTVPVIPCLPLFATHVLNLEPATVGAWIGGSVDTTGAVIASASIPGDPETLRVAAIVKMEQNSIIGLVCLALAMWSRRRNVNETICGMLWEKFPKFVLGFILMSFLVSFTGVDSDFCIAWLFFIGEWFGTMGFVAIGLNIRLDRLVGQAGNSCSMLGLYLVGQTCDVLTTLLMAWLAFTQM